MTYMIIERYYRYKIKKLYQRMEIVGRQLPEGVTYVDSWVDEGMSTCYTIMESETYEQLKEWMNHWKEFCEFEVIPVISNEQAKEKALNPQLQ
ncbi:DUF3303 domain-containing protein [Croceitalea marina]|uniref:DUF3303 domain-containing protein n=1 Tax=Croceitalea marina TaxID=1775166 RepID=A0ABW5MRL3_9FLAO